MSIQRILMMLNQRHTTVVAPQIYEMVSAAPSEMKPWHDEAAKTDSETVSGGTGTSLARCSLRRGRDLRFRVWYCQGSTSSTGCCLTSSSSDRVLPGDTVLSINGQPRTRVCRGNERLTWLRLPILSEDRLYLTETASYSKEPSEVEFGRADGTDDPGQGRVRTLTGPGASIPADDLGRTDNVYTTMLAGEKSLTCTSTG